LLAHALEETGETAEAAVMVGDRSHDIHAARDNGMASVAVKWGYGTPEDWRDADHVIDRPHELLGAVDRLFEVSR
jgi:phosphoglycolate phosphatase